MYSAFNNLQAMKVNFRNRKVHLNLPKHQITKFAQKKQSDTLKGQFINQSNHKTKNITPFGSNHKPNSQTYERIQMDHSKHTYVDTIAETIHLIGQEYVNHLNEGKQERFRAALLSSITKLQARDRKIIIQYNFQIDSHGLVYFDFGKQQEIFKQWLGQVHFRVVSTSFDFQINKLLTYEEVKVYCSENLLLNIILFLERVQNRIIGISLSGLMLYIDDVLHENLQYLLVKYPQAKQMKPNKRLRAEVLPINNIQNDANDLLQFSGIKFEFNQSQNYNSEIMKFVNYIIQSMTSPVKIENQDFSFAEGFSQIVEELFSSVFVPQNIQIQLKKKKLTFWEYKKQINTLFENNKEVKQYRQKVSKYSSYKIGTKINPNTQLFTEAQIKAGFFEVKSTSILRILTKWIQQLQKKIFQAKEYLQKRSFRFKSNKNCQKQKKQYNKLNSSQKNDLFLEASKQVQNLKKFIKNIRQNAFSIEGQLAISMQRTKQRINVPKNQYLVGQFSSKLEDAASSSLLSYLNQIIHILILIPKNIRKKYEHDQEMAKQMDIDLITFKVSDLLRCKFSSHQNQILRVYRQLKLLSDEKDYLKIVRIKDRLEVGTRDILINVMYMNVMLCQIQLAVTDEIDTKQQAFDAFNHYLYQLKRANLGCVMQSACIWAHFDQRSRIFKKIKQKQIEDYYMNGVVKRVFHNCGKELADNNLPFVCSICSKFYFSQQGIIKHKKCTQCNKYFRCSLCFENNMSQKQLKIFLGLQESLGIFSDEFKQWDTQQYPIHGLIIPKKNKQVEVSFFTTILWKEDAYIVKTVANENPQNNQSQKVEVEVIIIIRNNDVKQWKKLKQNYIIYQWKQKRIINKTIKPASIAQQRLEEQMRKEQQQRQKWQKKQRQIQQIKKKWKVKAKGKDKSSRPGSAESGASKNSHDSKHSAISKMSEQQNLKKVKPNKATAHPKTKLGLNPGLKTIQQNEKYYNQSIAKRSDKFELRVAFKKIVQDQLKQQHYLILGPYIKQKQIRAQLKKIYNHKIVRQNLQRKIQVLFLQDLMIEDQLDFDNKQSLKYEDSFSKIHEIYLDSNYIYEVKFLEKMPRLNVIHLNYNMVTDMSSFKQLKEINELMLQYNQIQKIEGIANNQNLIQLNLNHNYISIMTGLQGIKKLEILNMADNRFKTIQNLKDLSNLKKLDLAYNYISKIEGLQNLASLQDLDLSANMIEKIQNIDNLLILKKLYIHKNKISKIEGLQNLKLLKFLDLHRNKLKKIENINYLQNLIYLNLSGNKIRKIEGLKDSHSLIELNLSQNQIVSLKDFIQNNMANLRLLDMSYNGIKKLIDQIFEFLPKLEQFFLNSNPIQVSPSQRKIYEQLKRTFQKKSQFSFIINSDFTQTMDTQSQNEDDFLKNKKQQSHHIQNSYQAENQQIANNIIQQENSA